MHSAQIDEVRLREIGGTQLERRTFCFHHRGESHKPMSEQMLYQSLDKNQEESRDFGLAYVVKG